MILFHFFFPWHYAEVENWLAAMEQDGWRLERMPWPYRFRFVPCKPKNSRYFFLFTFPKSYREYDCENALRQKGANDIPVSLFHNLTILRMTRHFESAEDAQHFQELHFRYVYRQELCISLLFFVDLVSIMIILLHRADNDSLRLVIASFAFCISLLRCCYCLVALFSKVVK